MLMEFIGEDLEVLMGFIGRRFGAADGVYREDNVDYFCVNSADRGA